MSGTKGTMFAVAVLASGCCLGGAEGASYAIFQSRGMWWDETGIPWGGALTVDPRDQVIVRSGQSLPPDVVWLFDSAGTAVEFPPVLEDASGEDGSCPHERAVYTCGVSDGSYTLVRFLDGDLDPNNCVGSECDPVTFAGRAALVVGLNVESEP